jgi:glutathione S-transferase
MSAGAAGMLPDGSNPEFVDPDPPLGFTSKADLKDVVVHGTYASPTCCRVITFLLAADVPFKLVNAPLGKKGSDYPKMPVIDVSGRQINDGFIILKHLVPVLLGVPFDERNIKPVALTLAASVEAALGNDGFKDWAFGDHGWGVPSFFAPCMGPVLYKNVIQSNIARAETAGLVEVRDMTEYLQECKSKFAGTFFGGASWGQVDLFMYGTLAPFIYKECDVVCDALENADLVEWYERMQEVVPYESLFPPDAA